MKKMILLSVMAFLLSGSGIASNPSSPNSAAYTNVRSITTVETVSVSAPVGTVPRLPYQLWVTYSDGTAEYRQVKWLNAAEATETAEADAAINPVGTEYRVRGFIIGDNTTSNGYPVSAQVRVVSGAWDVPASTPVAATLPLDQVSIDGDNRLTWNRDLDIDQLISLPVKQQLYNYRDTYGLPTDGYPEADGWDSPTTKLKGHGSGHYMSAMAMAFASCRNQSKKDILRSNIKTMIDELRRCQERTFVWNDSLGRYWEARDFAPEEELKTMRGSWADFDRYKQHPERYGYGYLNAIPAQHCALIEMYRAYNNEEWVWAPYYSVHKQLAGLIDIATYIDDKATAAKALLIAKDMGLWVWNRLHYRTFVKSDGRQDERRARPGNRHEMWNMYIAGEVGGMAESMARLAEMTGTPEERQRLLEGATYFDSPAFFDPLARNIDAIRTRHANQHIPMVTGALRAFRGNNNPYYYNLAENFWTMIQGRYRYAMGGVGNGEMFRQPYSQITSMCNNVSSWGGHITPESTINETCCAYNLAKLTKDLNCFRPDDARYMDYYERVLYNQIVGSVNPRHYQTVYQYAVGLNASKPWGNETPQATCCGGTGVENHVKYQEAAYFVSSPSTGEGQGEATLWVALYMPTTAHWQHQGVTIRQDCLWPAEKSTITICSYKEKNGKSKKPLTVKLRVPYWATEGFDVKLNGRSIARHYQPGSYVAIPARRWGIKDKIVVTMPFTKHLDFGPDKMDRAPASVEGDKTDYEPMWTGTLMYGPLVMATTGITDWDQATIAVNPDLGDVAPNTPKPGRGYDANLYTMEWNGHTFIPDYAVDHHATHYFRFNLPAATAESAGLTQEATDTTQLRELLIIAKKRVAEQQAWNSLAVKVPEYAPWAKHGYARLTEQMTIAHQLLNRAATVPADSSTSPTVPTQEEIDKAAAALNAVINNMRPGNLAELEDMQPLLQLLDAVKQRPDYRSQPAVAEAVDYAGMVIRYVSNGSGTLDMIERAIRQLKSEK